MNQKKYWNKVADEKLFTTPFQMSLFKKHVSKKANILDVGCGYGRTLNELYANGFTSLCGIDFSSKMIKRGNTLNPDINLLQQNSDALPFDNCTFDAVILIAVMTCMISNSQLKKVMDEIYRVLQDNGIIYINDFLINSDERNLNRYEKYERKYKKYGVFELPEGAVLRHYTKERVNQLTSKFELLRFQDVIFTTMNKNSSKGFYYMGRKL